MKALKTCRVLLCTLATPMGCFQDVADVDDTQPTRGTSTSTAGDGTTSGPDIPRTSSSSTDADPSSSGDFESTTSSGGVETGIADSSSSGSTSGSSSSSSGVAEFCGDAVINGDELCEPGDLAGRGCETFGFASGMLACNDSCQFDFDGCVPPQDMVFVPAGVFTMGSAEHPDEMPIREVTMAGYFIDIFEVTAAQYELCMVDGDCPVPMSTANQQFDDQCNVGLAGREDHPVNCVGFTMADTYCTWAGKQLPTEAQWEKAARSDDARRFPWGDGPAPSATCTHAITGHGGQGCGEGSTAAVGGLPLGASPYGAQDMSGNVWEWVSDYYAATYDGGQIEDPTGPAGGVQRVIRGGGWFQNDSAAFTTSRRFAAELDLSDAFIGFRCAAPMPEPK